MSCPSHVATTTMSNQVNREWEFKDEDVGGSDISDLSLHETKEQREH